MAAFLDFDGLSRFYDNLKTYIASVVDNPVDLSNYVKKTQDQTIDSVYINGGTSETQGASLFLTGIVQGDSSPWQLTTRKGDYYYSWYGDSDGKLHFFTDDTRKERTSDVVAYISDLTPYALTSSLDGYLPLTGGTITGVITASTPTGAAPYVIDTSDPENAPDDPVDRAWISANRKNGAFFEAEEDGTIYSRLVLRYPSHSTQSGWFRLRAYNTTGSSELIGTPEGSLTWKGNELATDNNVVHLAGTEDITGKKTIASNLNIKNASLTRGTNPSKNSWIYMTFSGTSGDATNQRFGTVASGVYTNGTVRLYLEAYKNTSDTTTNAQLGVTYPASGDPYASAPTTPTGSTGTEIVTADYLNSTNSGVVHTTGDETIAGIKSFTGKINIADGAGITFTSNGVTQSLISSVLESVSGNNAVNLRLGYGGSTYVTGGECCGQITADNGFSYGGENVQLMADGNVYLRPGLGSGWNADLGVIATSTNFRPIANGGSTLGSSSYYWGGAYLGTTYMNGSIVFDETATISGTSTRHVANISMNNSSLNFGAYDQTNSKWIWWATPAGVNTFNGNAATATKATQDADGNNIADTYLSKSGGTMTGTITRNGVLAQSGNASGSISIQNGTSAAGGGGIWMYGASNANAGKVRLQAYDTMHKKYCALDANGDGTLTWCGDSIATDNNVVHLTGAETITGVKTHKAEICMQFTSVTKGTIPTANRYMSYRWADNAGTTIGGVQNYVYKTSGNVMTRMYAYHNDADTDKFASIGVVYPKTGDPYASCPSTPDGSTGTQIVTADFLNSTVAKYLPLAGGTMTGRITSSTDVSLQLNRASGDTYVVSANRTDTGAGIRFGIGSGGTNKGIYDTNLSKWIAYSDGTNACTQLGVTSTSDDNATHIATTGWTKDVLASYATQSWVEGKGYLTSHQSITGKINVSGSRGALAGYQTPLAQTAAFSVTYSTNDIVQLTGAVKVTVSNSTASIAWTKVVDITNASATIALGSKWKWVGGATPTVSANCTLVLHWNKTFGIASLLKTTA